jgi:hypothetical protein
VLPFLAKKRQVGVIVESRKPDGDVKEQSQESEENQGLEACAQDLLSAIERKDARALANAIKAAFEICESYPHEEGEHSEDYDAQNAMAARKPE